MYPIISTTIYTHDNLFSLLFIDFKPTMECPICLDSLKNPISFCTAPHMCCRRCLQQWITQKPECPLCREKNVERFNFKGDCIITKSFIIPLEYIRCVYAVGITFVNIEWDDQSHVFYSSVTEQIMLCDAIKRIHKRHSPPKRTIKGFLSRIFGR